MGLEQDEQSLYVFWPERRQLHRNGFEEVCGNESDGSYLQDNRISSHAEKQKEKLLN